MGSKKPKKIILLDADVVSHFIVGGEMYMLPTLFPYETVIIDKVYSELHRFRRKKIEVDNLINQKLIRVVNFPEDHSDIKQEYYRLKNDLIGDGEAACMAVARYRKDIIGSSNLRDIKSYCAKHNITYLTTMDFLCHALSAGKMDIDRCNAFISKVLASRSKLPVKSMEEYECREIEI